VNEGATTRPEAHELDPDGHFVHRLGDDCVALEELANDLPRGPLSIERRRALEAIAHRLAGAAGTFGFPEIGEVAVALEDFLRGPDEADITAARGATKYNRDSADRADEAELGARIAAVVATIAAELAARG
jgi:HPt (histidine-containing phosphotransfer) domain-containing protein